MGEKMGVGGKIVKNASWIIGCRIVQSVLGLIITMFSARYLGPSGYGIINYAASIVAFFVPIMQLGLNAILVREIVNNSEKEGEILGTSIAMSLFSSFVCVIGVIAFCMIANRGEPMTIIVCILYSVLLIFQSLEMIQYWFQAKLMSKYTSVIMLIAYMVVSFYKLILLITESSLYMFAIAQAIDYAIIAFSLLVIYYKKGLQKLRFSWSCAKDMFSRSKHYIISGLMVTIFAQTDKIMLKIMIDETAVGCYSVAANCASMTAFIFIAIIDSARPTIFESRNQSVEKYEQNICTLYSVIISLAFLQCVFMTVFSEIIIYLLYGSQYLEATSTLCIVVWYTVFSYIGSVRNIWMLSEGKQNLLWIINLSGALSNVILNAILIPYLGSNGAALASLITQLFTNIGMGFILKEIRHNNKLMLKSLDIRLLYRYYKMHK